MTLRAGSGRGGRRWTQRAGVTAVAVSAVVAAGVIGPAAASAHPGQSSAAAATGAGAPVNLWISDQNAGAVTETAAGGATRVVGSGLTSPNGVAVDAKGDVYVADPEAGRVVEFPAGGGPEVNVGTGLQIPEAVAVDAAGDVYIADFYSLVEVPADGGPQVTVADDFAFPIGVALDGAGNVYVADNESARVVEIPADGGPQVIDDIGTVTEDYLWGIAADTAGDLYVIEDTEVVKIPAGGGPRSMVGTGVAGPIGVAVDAAGDVFITDASPDGVVEVPASGTAQLTIDTATTSPYGIAVAPGSPPGIVTAVHGDSRHPGTARVRFTPGPAGGDPITYRVTATDITRPAQPTQTVTTPTSPARFRGLTGGDRYTFTVTSLNTAGPSQPSHPSPPVRIRGRCHH